MKHLVWAAAAASILLAGGAQAAGAKYESAVVGGTASSSPGLFRIEVATGKVWYVFGGVPQFTAIKENAPLPAGDYHLDLVAYPFPDGKVMWTLYRLDVASGRTWIAQGGGDNPLLLNEVAAPK